MNHHTDIPALLERLQVQGQRRGQDWWASCPLQRHGGADSTPSWRIHDEPGHEKHGLHVCYGCGGGGGPLSLVRDVLGLDDNSEGSTQAREWLSDNAALPFGLPHFELEVKPLRGTFKIPAGARFTPMDQWPEPARRYLETRGVPVEQVDRWGIGYAVDGRLAGRVVIPVRAADGRLAAFVGRAFAGSLRRYDEADEKDGADLNVVFGEEHWPAPACRGMVHVCEGTFDGLAVERLLPGPIAALRGSQLRLAQIAKLSTFPSVVVVTDPDRAGEKAAGAIREALGRWCEVRRAVLPPLHDAAKLALVDPHELVKRLVNAAQHRPDW